MNFSSRSNHRNDLRDSKLRTLLNRPLHAVKLKDRKNKSDGRGRRRLNRLAKFEFNSVIGDRENRPAPNFFTG